MTTVANIATIILNSNNWTTPTATNLEYLIDDVIDYVNLMAGQSIADLSGAAGSKSIVGTDAQIACVKFHAVLLGKAYNDRGPNTAVSGLSVATVLQDPQYAVYKDFSEKCVSQLRTRSFLRT